jgi:TRAP-type C4-dicarboxylate transport system permease large subunit
MALFVAAPIAKVPYEKTAFSVLPFLLAEVLVLMAIVYIPGVTCYIPRLLGF